MGTLSRMQSCRRGCLSHCGAACEDAPERAVRPMLPAGKLSRPDKPEQLFHDLRTMVLTLNPGTGEAFPTTGQQNPELPALVLYIPRKNEREPRPRAGKDPRRISHGSARARKNLRGVRMSVVPRPYTGECLLQEMREETERFSYAREPKTARTTADRAVTGRVATERADCPDVGGS